MAGHSKWANIKHRKERVDAKRGKIFTRIIKEITVAAKLGGSDVSANPRLRLALEKAKEGNMPNDNIDRAIKRGCGQLEGGVSYSEIVYEGYGVGGAAVLVYCLTDNKNRTYPEVRHAFTKFGGNLGTDGSVSYLFHRCGQLLFENIDNTTPLMEIAIENGADDFIEDEGGVEIICPADGLSELAEKIKQAMYSPDTVDIIMRPNTEINLVGDEASRMQKLLDLLEDLDDTQHVYTNAIIEEAAS